MCCLCMSSQFCLERLGRCGGILVNDDLLALVLRLLAVAKEDDLDREVISVSVGGIISKCTLARKYTPMATHLYRRE